MIAKAWPEGLGVGSASGRQTTGLPCSASAQDYRSCECVPETDVGGDRQHSAVTARASRSAVSIRRSIQANSAAAAVLSTKSLSPVPVVGTEDRRQVHFQQRIDRRIVAHSRRLSHRDPVDIRISGQLDSTGSRGEEHVADLDGLAESEPFVGSHFARRHPVQLRLVMHLEIAALGEAPTQQSVGVNWRRTAQSAWGWQK